MTIFLRRVLASRNILLRRSFYSQCRNLSHIISSSNIINGCGTHFNPTLQTHDFIRDSRRSFAKGKKSKDNDAGSTIDAVPDVGPIAKATAISQNEAAIASLSQQLSKLRTGRASAGMLDHIIVESGSLKMPLGRMAITSVLDSKTLSITPYDPSTLKAIHNAIVASPLGLNPKEEGERLSAVIPPLTKDHIQAVNKVVAKSCEDVKQSIRRARQKALDIVKKAGSGFSKDDIKKLEKEVDEITKKFIKSAEDMCKMKEKEIAAG